MYKFKHYLQLTVVAAMICAFTIAPFYTPVKTVSAKPLGDTISDLLSLMSVAKLQEYATALVAYGPRRADVYQSFIDASCTYSGVDYPKSTIEMSSDYVRQAFLNMGYQDSQFTMEYVPNGAGSWGQMYMSPRLVLLILIISLSSETYRYPARHPRRQ